MGKLKAACAAVESFLLFDPVDTRMLENRKYYSIQPKVKEDYFSPRQVIVFIIKIWKYKIILFWYKIKKIWLIFLGNHYLPKKTRIWIKCLALYF